MGICKRRKVTVIGLANTYQVSIPTYGCRKIDCSGRMKHQITLPNPYAGPRMNYDYEVQTEVIRFRWQEHCTYEEICARMLERYGISIDHSAIELILKSYEIICAKSFRPYYKSKIAENKGLLLCVDVMEPLKGRMGFLIVYDYWTGLTLGAKRMPNGKQETYEAFFHGLKNRIAEELNAPILGIISDAHVQQRKAIAAVFLGIPHCLCQYHFYNLVLKEAKLADSGVVTQIRAELRDIRDIKEYHLRCQKQTLAHSQYEVLQPLFEPLDDLCKWHRKPKDPCFTGLELHSRVSDILHLFRNLDDRVNTGRIKISKYSQKVVIRMIEKLDAILSSQASVINELQLIHGHLENIVSILDAAEENAAIGLERMQKLCETLRETILENAEDSIEMAFVKALIKFIDTKGAMIFNYRKISDAPTTNNFQELKFKQLKHYLRRVIGHSAAKEYLMVHGERIVFVQPNESRENILEIMKSGDQVAARLEITDNRRSLDSWIIVMHNRVKWAKKLEGISDYIAGLEVKPIIRG